MPDFGISHQLAADLVAELTPREAQVAEAIAMGETRLSIRKRLGVRYRTVEIHVAHVRAKLGVLTHGIARVWFAAMLDDANAHVR